MKCPHRGAAELIHDVRDLPYTCKGETTTIAAATGNYCTACGENMFDSPESARLSAAMLAFNRQVNASIVDPGFIATMHKKLALVKLLKVLERHPELLNEVRSA